MAGDPFENSDPTRLSRMLALPESEQPWQPHELGAVLRHQLAAPVTIDLPQVVGTPPEGSDPPGDGIQSIGDLLAHPHPPLPWLLALKEFAKANALHPNSPLPREISSVLYYGAILSAWARCGRRITGLDRDAIHSGVKQVLDATWIDSGTRSLLSNALTELNLKGEQA